MGQIDSGAEAVRLPRSHQKFLQKLCEGSSLTNRQIIKKLQAVNFLDNDRATHQVSRYLCWLFTKQSYTFFINMIGPSHWRNYILSDAAKPGGMMDFFPAFFTRIDRYVFFLYEEDFGSVRETMHYLHHIRHPDKVPYLHVLVQNAVKKLLGKSLTESTQSDIDELFGKDKKLLKWVKQIKARGEFVKHYSGQTNTKIGFYDKIFDKFPDLKELIKKPTEVSFDLGGGFATPDVSRVLDREMVSLDIISPKQAIDMNLHFFSGSGAEEKERQYREKLMKQKYLEYDIFNSPLPDQYSSYLLTSFGFLTSSVHSLSKKQPKYARKLEMMNRLYFGVYRIVELASKGKDVALFTYGRPHHKYMNRLAYMKFSQGRVEMVKLPTTREYYRPFEKVTVIGAPVNKKLIRTWARSLAKPKNAGDDGEKQKELSLKDSI